jgi:hydrophobic/amphiphilic exporter-1 (mainly G- bacteria), HAE1 family
MLMRSVVNKPTTLMILTLLILGFGIYASLGLPIDLYPDISPPILLVFTNYEGAGPEEVENSVTKILEAGLSNVGHIDKITSTSSSGSSQIIIRFTWGTNMDSAGNDVRDKLEFVKDYLPDAVKTPQIFKFDPSMIPILQLVVQGNRSSEELRKIADDLIVPRLQQTDGVAMASVSGGSDRAIRVEIPQNRLEAYNLTLTQVAQMLQGQNVQISAGSITEGSKKYLIRTSGEYKDVEEIKNTVVAYKGASESGAKAIRLRDIANVYDGYKDENSAVFINGKPGVYITVQKQSGTNSVKTADNVITRLPKINGVLPLGIKVDVLSNTTDIIRSSLNQVVASARDG